MWSLLVLHISGRTDLPYPYLPKSGHANPARPQRRLGRAQMVALLYYTFSYFPGGTMGVRFVFQLFSGACMQCCNGVRAAAFR